MLKIKRSRLRELTRNKFGTDNIENQNQILIMISVSLAARTSYTVVGDEKEVNYEKMIELHDRLIAQNPPHSSPMEHCAKAMDDGEYESFIKGVVDSDEGGWYVEKSSKGWCRNFKGFIPYRHIVETKEK